MDSLTQVVLGGAVGEACLGRKAGNKAVMWGAIAGTIPDLDVLGNFFINGAVEQAHFHRGPTHSLVFALVVAPLLGRMISRIHRKEGLGARPWSWLAFWGLVTHPLLDIFTTWGTEFFWPFWGERIAVNSVFVVDPLYTLPFLTCLVIVLFLRRDHRRRRLINWIGIGWSCLYLAFGLVQKSRARAAFKEAFAQQGLEIEYYMTKPTPLNAFLWGTVAKSPTGYYLGYYSLPGGPEPIHLQYYHDTPLPPEIAEQASVRLLHEISKGYLLVQPATDGWWVSDLRYMTAEVDLDGDDNFIFRYFFRKDEAGELVIEERRGIPDLNQNDLNRFWEVMWNGFEQNPP